MTISALHQPRSSLGATLACDGLKVTSPAPRDAWRDAMRADPEAVPYQSPAWFDSLCAHGTHRDVSRLYETADGRRLVLPLACRRYLPARLGVVASMPSSWGMGGLIGKAINEDDVRAVFADLRSLPYASIRIRPNPLQGELWARAAPDDAIVTPRTAHILDLDEGFDKILAEKFHRETRRHIRKAEREGVVVESDNTGRLMPVFYGLLLSSFDRWAAKQNEPRLLTRLRGLQRDSLSKFQAIAEQMGEACTVWIAYLRGTPVAGSIVLQYENVNDSRGAIDREALGTSGANDLLQMLSIKDACEKGCRYYHLGETGSNTSLAHYKERFGARPHAYAEYTLERLPLTRMDTALRSMVKKAIGFKDQ